jgi:hypothetical protein
VDGLVRGSSKTVPRQRRRDVTHKPDSKASVEFNNHLHGGIGPFALLWRLCHTPRNQQVRDAGPLRLTAFAIGDRVSSLPAFTELLPNYCLPLTHGGDVCEMLNSL